LLIFDFTAFEYDIPTQFPELRQVLRREFDKNRKVEDIRVIDMLVIKVRSQFHALLSTYRPFVAYNLAFQFCTSFLCSAFQGQMELKETVEQWKQKGHVMTYLKETIEPKPKGFLSKFLAGQE